MDTAFTYVSASIRLVSENDDRKSESFSGIALRDERDKEIDISIICICPVSELKGFNIVYNCRDFNGKDTVIWNKCSLRKMISLVKANDELRRYLQFFEDNGFKLIPANDKDNLSILILNDANKATRNVKNWLPINFGDAQADDEVIIYSSPFNFTNSLLFSRFASKSTVNTVLKVEENPIAYMTDIKYLENMVGAIAFNGHVNSLGLVIGNVRKMNGDGELLIIVAWPIILKTTGLKFPCINRIDRRWSTQYKAFSDKATNHSTSVVSLVVTEKKSSFWGSAVYFNESTLVTNRHVVRPFESDSKSVDCIIYLSNGTHIKLTETNSIFIPFEDLDLAFISLTLKEIQMLKISGLVPVRVSQHCEISEKVFTVGFGLYLDYHNITPLISRGIISAVMNESVFVDSTQAMDSLIITSASCWNGSSGGGLFNERGELLGIICSNAKVKIDPSHSNIVETNSSFCLCLPVNFVQKCFEKTRNGRNDVQLNQRVIDTWNLEVNHQDLIRYTSNL